MRRWLGIAMVAVATVGVRTAAAQSVKHAANEAGHAVAHAGKETAKTTRHAANEVGHATAHAAKETASTTKHAANEAGHTTAHAAKETADAVTPPTQAELARSATVSERAARAGVTHRYPGAVIESSELEKQDGRVVWEVKFHRPGVEGKQKVWVDARTAQMWEPRHQ